MLLLGSVFGVPCIDECMYLAFDVTAGDVFFIACHLRCSNFFEVLVNFHLRPFTPHALFSRVKVR